MATPEAKASHESGIRAAQWGCRMFRNSSGAFKNAVGALVRFGLMENSKRWLARYRSSDKIGFTPVTITPDMVGKTIPVFTSFEDKKAEFKLRETYKHGSREWMQKNWCDFIKSHNGIAGFVRGADDVDKILQEWIKWAQEK